MHHCKAKAVWGLYIFPLKIQTDQKVSREPKQDLHTIFFHPKKTKVKNFFFLPKKLEFRPVGKKINHYWKCQSVCCKKWIGQEYNTAINLLLLERRCFYTTNNLKRNQPPLFFGCKKYESCSCMILSKQRQRLRFTKRLFT